MDKELLIHDDIINKLDNFIKTNKYLILFFMVHQVVVNIKII